MLSIRASIGLTQTGLADLLGVSRRTIADWEAGNKYPKVEHLKALIVLAIQQRAFPAGQEREDIRTLWKAARQKVLLDETWLSALLAPAVSPAAPDPVVRSRRPPLNLPIQPTPFIGRSSELNEIAALLRDPACRLLTLVGPGGIGKTRLALEVAATQSALFADGIAFVALASLSTPPQIASAIGESLDLSFAGYLDPMDQLLDYLRPLNLLLVLDNFEHLLDGANVVYEVLQHAPAVKVLVTSRERLELRAEWLFDVEGLAYPVIDPQGAYPQGLVELTGYSALQLFVQRATQVQPRFPLTEANLHSIVNICEQVAGMPLAIELAAAGLRSLSLAEIERQIYTNLNLLATSFRDAPARHRSLRAVFDQSWLLLNDSEQALFSRLAVFRGGCTAAAAEQVTGATLPTLALLVGKSLLRDVSSARTAKTPLELRFAVLEPLREYALEQLELRGEAEAVRSAHANYYLALAEAASTQWGTPAVDAAIAQLDGEYDNLRAALQWARDQGQATLGLQIAVALWKFWRSCGFISEGRAWLEDLLALADDSPSPASVAARLAGLHAAAWFASDQHDYARATHLFEQSRALRRTQGEVEAETSLRLNAARRARVVGQYHEATVLLEEVLEQHRTLGMPASQGNTGLELSLYELGQVLRELGLVYREQGEFDRAAALFTEGLQLHQALGDREGIALALLGLADLARDQRDPPTVRRYAEESLSIFRDLGMQWAVGFALHSLAHAAYEVGDLTRAAALASESVALFRNLQSDGSVGEVLVTLGNILRAQGELNAAHDTLTEALTIATNVGPRLFVAAALEGLAGVMSLRDQIPQAVQSLARASMLRIVMGTPLRPADQAAVQALLARARATLDATTFAALWVEAEKTGLSHGQNSPNLALGSPRPFAQA